MIIHGKVALITGAANGIGKATATEFIHNGAKVILADVQDDVGPPSRRGWALTRPTPTATSPTRPRSPPT
jgi:NAD(P)-dependent dehydrogenase (short-subunit alcohol dehydrogenase family)